MTLRRSMTAPLTIAAALLIFCAGRPSLAAGESQPATGAKSASAPAAPSSAASDAHDHGNAAATAPAAKRAGAAAPQAARAGTMVEYPSGDTKVHGYLALPKGTGPFPAVIVIQEWWGLNDQIKSVADRLAAQGYVALAPDLYRGKVTDKPEMAMELMRALAESRGTADLQAAYAYLRAHAAVGAKPIGSVGFCMGGRYSLLLALAEPKLAAAVVCYGRPEQDGAKLRAIGAPVLGIYGGQDKGIPAEMVEGFASGMKAAGRSIQIKVFPEAGHGFMNPNNPTHRADDTAAAWTLIDAFFAKHLLGKP